MNILKDNKFIRIKLLFSGFLILCAITLIICSIKNSELPDVVGRNLTEDEKLDVIGRNSSLIDYVYLSPNADFPRTDPIQKITIHHMAANLPLDNLGYSFAEKDRNASSNYAIDSNGDIALYVEESNRAWTSSSPENDHQAVTIEVANDEMGGSWHVSDKAFDSLIDLCVDICQRNGIEKLDWTGDDTGNLTVHRMFSETTECPGRYLLNKMPEIAQLVNEKLEAPTTSSVRRISSCNSQLPEECEGSYGE